MALEIQKRVGSDPSRPTENTLASEIPEIQKTLDIHFRTPTPASLPGGASRSQDHSASRLLDFQEINQQPARTAS
jgi:hypothetical protein